MLIKIISTISKSVVLPKRVLNLKSRIISSLVLYNLASISAMDNVAFPR